MIKDLLGALGSWDVTLKEGTPSEVIDALDMFGHVAIVRGPVDVESLGDKLLPQARYVGVLREKSRESGQSIGGVGMAVWAGDEDGKGEVIQEWIDLVDAPLDAALYAVMPTAVTVGGIYNQPGKTYTGRHRFETPREAMNTICAAFGVEWYISNEAELFAGTTEQLYDTTPNAVVVRRGAGVDLDLTALGGSFSAGANVNDWTSRVVLLGQHTDFGPDPFITYIEDADFIPYFDMYGNPVKRTRLVSETFTTEGSIQARAQLQLNRFNRLARSLKVTSEKYETEGNFRVGDFAYVYDPETGIFDESREIVFRGEVLHPDVIRVTGISYPISEGHTVAFRGKLGKWIDLTRWVVFETGSNEITVGDLPKSLGGGSVNVARDRADAATGTTTDTVAPAMPTGVQVTTNVIENARGTGIVGQASLTWAPVLSNEDGSTMNDFANYVIAWKLSSGGEWKYAFTYEAAGIVDVIPGRNYDFRIASQDVNGNTSDYSPTVSALSAADNIAPGSPADPAVTSYLGQLRIEWNGNTSAGTAMPPDFNRVDVHVGTTAAFVPSPSTLVSSLVTKGVAYATAPYGSTRYVKLVAYDISGNASAASGSIAGATAKVGDGDIASMNVGRLSAGTIAVDIINAGRFATALTGARSEFNASGFYRFDSLNRALFSADANGVLVTGTFRTALSGRRVEIRSAGSLSQIDMWAPNGYQTFIRSFTEASGIEAIQMGHGDPTTRGLDERINMNSGGHYTSRFRRHDFVCGESYNLFSAADSFGTQMMGVDMPTRDFVFRPSGWTVLGTGEHWEEAYDFRQRVFPASNAPVDLYMGHDGVVSFDLGIAYYGGRILLDKSTQAFSTSPRLQFFTSQNYGGYIRFNGAATYQDMEFKYFDDSFYINTVARAFVVASDMTGKEVIEDSSIDCLSAIKGAKVKKYRRKAKDEEGRIVEREDEIGLIAQEAPAQIVHGSEADGNLGVDLYQMSALLWGAVQQMSARLDALDRKPGDGPDPKGKVK